MFTLYEKNLSSLRVAENNKKVSEIEIQALWMNQLGLEHLQTPEGLPIQVLSPGIWNASAGPDFLHAHLLVGNQELRGDIEVHLDQGGWRQHGHEGDPRYDSVILHLLYHHPCSWAPPQTKRGPLLQVSIEHQLSCSLEDLLSRLDPSLYPSRTFAHPGACSKSVFGKLAIKEQAKILQSAASWRMKKKADFLKRWVEDPDLLCTAGVASALGFPQNTLTFLRLFLDLWKMRDASEKELLHHAYCWTGLFSPHFHKQWSHHPFYQQLLGTKQGKQKWPLVSYPIRPFHHPARRIGYLVKWIKDDQSPHTGRRLQQFWQQRQYCKGEKVFFSQLSSLIPDYSDDHWNSFYTFEKEKKNKYLPLMGDSLRQEIAANIFFPLLQDELLESGDLGSLPRLFMLFGTLPSSKSRKTDYLRQRFFSESTISLPLKSKLHEQGAYQIHRDYCLKHETSCVGCFFPQICRNERTHKRTHK